MTDLAIPPEHVNPLDDNQSPPAVARLHIGPVITVEQFSIPPLYYMDAHGQVFQVSEDSTHIIRELKAECDRLKTALLQILDRPYLSDNAEDFAAIHKIATDALFFNQEQQS